MQKVLVVDDDKVLRVLGKALKINGFLVQSADNGERQLKWLGE